MQAEMLRTAAALLFSILPPDTLMLVSRHVPEYPKAACPRTLSTSMPTKLETHRLWAARQLQVAGDQARPWKVS